MWLTVPEAASSHSFQNTFEESERMKILQEKATPRLNSTNSKNFGEEYIYNQKQSNDAA